MNNVQVKLRKLLLYPELNKIRVNPAYGRSYLPNRVQAVYDQRLPTLWDMIYFPVWVHTGIRVESLSASWNQ